MIPKGSKPGSWWRDARRRRRAWRSACAFLERLASCSSRLGRDEPGQQVARATGFSDGPLVGLQKFSETRARRSRATAWGGPALPMRICAGEITRTDGQEPVPPGNSAVLFGSSAVLCAKPAARRRRRRGAGRRGARNLSRVRRSKVWAGVRMRVGRRWRRCCADGRASGVARERGPG